MAIGYVTQHNSTNGSSVTVPLFNNGPAVADDILIVLAVGGIDGAGMTLPAISSTGAASTWSKVVDRDIGATDHEFRATVWWTKCVGGETGVTGDWGGGANIGLEVLWITAPGTLQQVYLMVDGTGTYDSGSAHRVIAGGANPSSDGEIYIGFTANGRDSYSYADLNINSGSYGADSGDGFDQFGAVKGIIHYAGPVSHTHTTADSVTYGINDIVPSELGVLGVRVAVAPAPTVTGLPVWLMDDDD